METNKRSRKEEEINPSFKKNKKKTTQLLHVQSISQKLQTCRLGIYTNCARTYTLTYSNINLCFGSLLVCWVRFIYCLLCCCIRRWSWKDQTIKNTTRAAPILDQNVTNHTGIGFGYKPGKGKERKGGREGFN